MIEQPTRSCGPCVECCRVIKVDDTGDGGGDGDGDGFSKPADVMCAHCTTSGCGIYDTRFKVCRTFLCGWLADTRELLRDRDRPDRSRIIITAPGELCPPTLYNRRVLVAHECDPMSSETTGRELIDRLVRKGYIVIVAARSVDSRSVRCNDDRIAQKVWGYLVREATQSGGTV